MDMLNRAKSFEGKMIRVRTKSGETCEGTLEAVDIDGEMTLRPPFSKTFFLNVSELESLASEAG